MATENPETCLFTTVPTVLAGEDACVLYVPEKEMWEGMPGRALGTTLADFLPGVDKAGALDRGYGGYVLTQAGELAKGLRGFRFVRVRTPEEIAVAFRAMPSIQQGLYWPPVLNTVVAANLMQYDETGVAYVAGMVWDFAWTRMAYRGPTKVVEEYFASHAPFALVVGTSMREIGGTFDYGVGSMTLPPCLHGTLNLSFTLAESSRYPTQTFSKTFSATNVTNWPGSYVLDEQQTFDGLLYIKKRVTAYMPY
jgi:hypothetical protein